MTDEIKTDSVAADRLRSLIERIERLEIEKAEKAEDIKEVYLEAKCGGFDTKILKRIISFRKKEASERQEEEAIFELYARALGMV
jgi:uncharacterized protein (UPF0335 family)